MRDEQQQTTTSEDRATQLLSCEALSLAIFVIKIIMIMERAKTHQNKELVRKLLR